MVYIAQTIKKEICNLLQIEYNQKQEQIKKTEMPEEKRGL